MTPVFEELGPLLKGIRNQLNNLTLQKSPPKVKQRKNKVSGEASQVEPIMFPDECNAGKAGKTMYTVLVGEDTNLYKTSKPSTKALITIDLHGCSKDEAVNKFDSMLPGWIDDAMKGESPWVIPINIICGGGSQILSEAVKNWIGANRQVANRPKGYFN